MAFEKIWDVFAVTVALRAVRKDALSKRRYTLVDPLCIPSSIT
jgi:hypothetical protein